MRRGNGSKLKTVSVAICTLNREEPLIHVLELLKTQTVAPLEILVVDQSEGHRPATRRYLEENRSRLRLFHLARPSTTAARNRVRKEARGDLVLFLDDDVLFHPTLIEYHLENYEDPEIGAVSGKVLYHGAEENDEPWAARVTRTGKYLRNFTSNRPCDIPTLYGCNMSIPREVLWEVGEFDEHYWGNFLWEEVDYAFQIRSRGYRIRYDPRAFVFHVMAPTGGSRNPRPQAYLESTVFNDWYFFFKYFPEGYFPFLLYRQKRTWFDYVFRRKGNPFRLLGQILQARSRIKKQRATKKA